jgi:hypothetical protein
MEYIEIFEHHVLLLLPCSSFFVISHLWTSLSPASSSKNIINTRSIVRLQAEREGKRLEEFEFLKFNIFYRFSLPRLTSFSSYLAIGWPGDLVSWAGEGKLVSVVRDRSGWKFVEFFGNAGTAVESIMRWCLVVEAMEVVVAEVVAVI